MQSLHLHINTAPDGFQIEEICVRCFFFSSDFDDHNGVRLESEYFQSVEPGISSYSKHPQEVNINTENPRFLV